LLHRVDLGNPDYVENWKSVDLFPRDSRVERCEAIEWLYKQPLDSVDEIRAYQLLEHLPSVGIFFQNAYRALKPSGILTIKTDCASWLPFYIPFLNVLGFGAHSSDKYRPILDHTDWPNHPEIRHFAIFTKLHLRNLGVRFGFEVVSIKRDWSTLGARLIAVYRKSV
jgi:predicted SAM-dependent methyltransferase